MSCTRFLALLSRKKIDDFDESETLFRRCLGVIELTLIGIGSMLGPGLYVATGEIARTTTGPAIIVSLIIAAIPVILTSFCYAEFASRFTRTGSSYSYSYSSLGEIWAFIVGWNLIIEYVLQSALIANGVTSFLNSMSGGQIDTIMRENVANWHASGFSSYPNVLALACLTAITLIAICGIKPTSTFCISATIISVFTAVFIIVVGFYFSNFQNWSTPEKFAPFGFKGIILGAASSYFCYIGFDTLTTASEEVIDPKRSIPIATNASTYMGVLLYLGVSALLTLMIPYNKLAPGAALPASFEYKDFVLAKYFVGCGGIFAMFTAMLCNMLAGPRILYAMATDGLLFSCFAKISAKTSVPVYGTVFCWILSAISALFLDLQELVEMVSIGTLIAYAATAVGVLVIRYEPLEEPDISRCASPVTQWFTQFFYKHQNSQPSNHSNHSEDETQEHNTSGDLNGATILPNQLTSLVAKVSIVLMGFSFFGFSLVVTRGIYIKDDYQSWFIAFGCVTGLVTIFALINLVMQPRRRVEFGYTTPWVPVTPIVIILINVLLLANLRAITWARFAVTMFFGKLEFVLSILHAYH